MIGALYATKRKQFIISTDFFLLTIVYSESLFKLFKICITYFVSAVLLSVLYFLFSDLKPIEVVVANITHPSPGTSLTHLKGLIL